MAIVDISLLLDRELKEFNIDDALIHLCGGNIEKALMLTLKRMKKFKNYNIIKVVVDKIHFEERQINNE